MNATTTTADDWADQALATVILDAARRTSKRFGQRKAFICSIFDELAPRLSRCRGIAWLARRMVELNRKGLIALSRADLVGAMDPEWVARSEIRYLNAEFHFVNVP